MHSSSPRTSTSLKIHVSMLAAATSAIVLSGCTKPTALEAERPEVARGVVPVVVSEDFQRQVLQSDRPVLVEFYMTWCRTCQMLMPTMEKLAGEYRGKALFAKVNLDESPEVKERYKIITYPTVILFVDGKETERWVNVHSAKIYREALNKVRP